MKSTFYPKKLVLLLAASACFAFGSGGTPEAARWAQEAQRVTIVRDDWGIAHVYGKTDADAVFGMIYAQAEDDFNRVETNYLNAMGRLAEAEGEAKIYQDLRMKLFIDPAVLKTQYAASPAWLKTLMNAFADGLNYYLAKHPEVKPRVIKRFEPWMALELHGGKHWRRHREGEPQATRGVLRQGMPVTETAAVDESQPEEPRGSNGIAIAPSNTVAHHALLLINPHTSFFFRSELQMVSEEGLNAYGAVTWGQFFVYQGFNDRVGWMHTSSGVDAIDEYLETVEKRGRPLLLQVRKRGAPSGGDRDHGAVQDGAWDGGEEVHRLPHASRARDSRSERQMGEHPVDAGAGEGADAIVHANQGEELQGIPADDGAESELVEQHDLRRCRR